MRVDCVVKLGGGALSHVEHWRGALDAIARAARSRRLVVVPGGGPFADTVRAVDARLGLEDRTAHWMAVLAMDQYAHLIVERLAGAVLVEDTGGVALALDRGSVPVLAPSRWLRAVDPLPHSWEVTSDSIAAWIAGALGAPRLVLVKPSGSRGDPVDPFFERARPPALAVAVVPADEIDERTYLG